MLVRFQTKDGIVSEPISYPNYPDYQVIKRPCRRRLVDIQASPVLEETEVRTYEFNGRVEEVWKGIFVKLYEEV